MPTPPAELTSHRDPKSEVEDDEDDLDDLDGTSTRSGRSLTTDVLANFNAPKASKPVVKQPTPSASASVPAPAPALTSPSAQAKGPGAEDDDDFEASLVEGMEQLLRQLAGDHPPGPMAGTSTDAAKGKTAAKASDPASSSTGGLEGEALSKEEEEEAWKKAVEMMLSGEGLDALGLDASGQPKDKDVKNSSALKSTSGPPGSGETKPDFEETIRRTMEQLKAPKAGSAGLGGEPDLAALLAQLGSDPSALEGLGDGDDELGGLLDGMMAQLMTKEVLQEPMAELAAKYPEYLASPPSETSKDDLETYRKQYELVKQIDQTFKKPGYSDEADGKEIARLVGEMQDLGGPPKEIMGDMPEGFDLGALGNDEACTIM